MSKQKGGGGGGVGGGGTLGHVKVPRPMLVIGDRILAKWHDNEHHPVASN